MRKSESNAPFGAAWLRQRRRTGRVVPILLLILLATILLAKPAPGMSIAQDVKVYLPLVSGGSQPPATATPTPTTTADVQPSLPLRAAFYYPWFPESWTQSGVYPYSNYAPSLGFYDSSDRSVIEQHIAAMQYGGISAGILSWWGQGSATDKRVPGILAMTAGSTFRWAIYHEPEGQGNPSVASLTSDLTYLRDAYGSDPSYLRINGRFVVFVYADAGDACAMVDRWEQANAGIDAYLVLKVFAGYAQCASQPDGWHQYAPAVATDAQGSHSYTISPGFYKVNSAPRLARDPVRWRQNVRNMVASGATFQLITTFNEWGEGTSVEPATQWASASGYGVYLDALHDNGAEPQPGTSTPTSTVTAATATFTPTSTPLPATATNTPSPGTCTATTLTKGPILVLTGANTEMKVSWQWSSNATFNLSWGTDATFALGNASVSAYDTTNHLYAYTITGLTPGVKYYYRAAVGAQCAGGSFFAPPAGSATEVKFFAYGDTRSHGDVHDDLAQQVIALYQSDPALQTLNIHVGDWVSTDTESDWTTEWFNPSYPNIREQDANIADTGVRGNHEYGATYWKRYFPQPFQPGGFYRSLDYGPMHIVLLDQYTDYDAGSAQYDWLESDLAASTKLWKFVVLHEPGWSAGGGHDNNTAVQTELQPLFQQYGVSVVFGGHNHYYARALVNDIVHLTVGGGGAGLSTPVSGFPYVVVASESHSFGQFTIAGNTLTAKIVDSAGVVIDSFSMTR